MRAVGDTKLGIVIDKLKGKEPTRYGKRDIRRGDRT